MLTQHSGQVYLALYKVDFRKAHAGLLAECYHLGLSPYRGDVVLFVGRCKTKIKVIHADENGLWLSYKKFDEDSIKTKLSFLQDPKCKTITTAELAMILEGSAYQLEKISKNRCKTSKK